MLRPASTGLHTFRFKTLSFATLQIATLARITLCPYRCSDVHTDKNNANAGNPFTGQL